MGKDYSFQLKQLREELAAQKTLCDNVVENTKQFKDLPNVRKKFTEFTAGIADLGTALEA